jgi:bifunctional non-homologous end joining protein LigD
MKRMNLEGMMAKRADSQYIENHRTDDWLKIKLSNTEEAIFVGLQNPGVQGKVSEH